jgi:hypothetical protein
MDVEGDCHGIAKQILRKQTWLFLARLFGMREALIILGDVHIRICLLVGFTERGKGALIIKNTFPYEGVLLVVVLSVSCEPLHPVTARPPP